MESPVPVAHFDQKSYEMPRPELTLGQREDPRHSMMGCWGLCHRWPLRFQVVLAASFCSNMMMVQTRDPPQKWGKSVIYAMCKFKIQHFTARVICPRTIEFSLF